MTNKTYQPLPDSLHIGESKIHGQGLVASENIPMGTDLGISHYRKGDDVIRTPLGGFINHSEDPSATRKQIRIEPYWDKWNVTTIKDIKKGEEITLKYTMYRVDNADQMCYNEAMNKFIDPKNPNTVGKSVLNLGNHILVICFILSLLFVVKASYS